MIKLKWPAFGLVVLAALALAGCSTTSGLSKTGLAAPGASQAKPPVHITQEAAITNALACFGNSWPNKDKFLFGVDATRDVTGKIDMASGSGTGNYLTKDASPFIVSALYGAGLRTIDLTANTTRADMIRFAGDKGTGVINAASITTLPDVLIIGKFVTMDFTGGVDVDVMIGPVGPIVQGQGVTVTTSVSVLNSLTGEVLGESTLRQYVNYSSLGVGIAYGKKILTTGGLSVSDQQQLQLEAARLPMVIGTLEAMSKATARLNFHGSVDACRGITQAVLTTI